MTQAAHRMSAQRCVAARTGLCRGAHWRRIVVVPDSVAGRVAERTGRVACARCYVVAPFSDNTKFVSQHRPYRAPCRQRCRAYRRALLRRIAAPTAPYRDTKRSLLTTIQILYRDSPHGQTTRARASLFPARRPTVLWPLLAMSWGRVVGPPGRIVPPLLHAPASRVTIQSIVS